MVSSALVQEYKNAIYLNNAAITFMERGEYHKASDTLKDALSLMEFIIRPGREQCVNEVIEVQAKIKRAAQRLACPDEAMPSSQVKLEVLCFNGSFDWRFLQVNSAIALLFRINDVESDEIQGTMHEIVPAILLSNYALAIVCLSTSIQSCSTQNGALQLLHMALSVLGTEQKLNSDQIEEVTDGNLFMAIAIKNNIGRILREWSLFSELVVSLQELEQLKYVAGEMTMVYSVIAAAAASA